MNRHPAASGGASWAGPRARGSLISSRAPEVAAQALRRARGWVDEASGVPAAQEAVERRAGEPGEYLALPSPPARDSRRLEPGRCGRPGCGLLSGRVGSPRGLVLLGALSLRDEPAGVGSGFGESAARDGWVACQCWSFFFFYQLITIFPPLSG